MNAPIEKFTVKSHLDRASLALRIGGHEIALGHKDDSTHIKMQLLAVLTHVLHTFGPLYGISRLREQSGQLIVQFRWGMGDPFGPTISTHNLPRLIAALQEGWKLAGGYPSDVLLEIAGNPESD